MEPSWAVWSVIVLSVVLANLPFVNERLFAIGPRRAPKSGAWRLLEWLLGCALAAMAGRALEAHLGQVSDLRWEFVVVWLCVCATMAFPGFVWRYLLKR